MDQLKLRQMRNSVRVLQEAERVGALSESQRAELRRFEQLFENDGCVPPHNNPPILCRSVENESPDHPRHPDARAGYFCRGCGKELAVGPVGRYAIEHDGGVPYCNGCGLPIAEKLVKTAAAADIAGDVLITPQAARVAEQCMNERGESIFSELHYSSCCGAPITTARATLGHAVYVCICCLRPCDATRP